MARWSARRVVVTIAAIVATVIVGGALVGGIALLRGGLQIEAVYDDTPAEIERWCRSLEDGIGPSQPFRSFDEVAQAVLSGSLAQPEPVADVADPDALRRWQQEHAPYLASSYLRLLEGYPKELSLATEVFRESLAQAHRAEELTLREHLRDAAQGMDRYVEQHC